MEQQLSSKTMRTCRDFCGKAGKFSCRMLGGLTAVWGGTMSTMIRGLCRAAKSAKSAAKVPFLPKGGFSPMTSSSPDGRLPAQQKQDVGLGKIAIKLPHHMAVSSSGSAPTCRASAELDPMRQAA